MSGISDKWVLDATLYQEDRPLAFCPIEEDGSVIVGLTFLGSTPPGTMVAVYHADGQDAVESWMESHPEVLAQLERDLRAEGRWPA